MVTSETHDRIEATLDEPDGSLPAQSALPALLAFRHPPAAGLITGHAHTPAASVLAVRPPMAGPGVTWTPVM